jgi:tRNA pseudouridine38-40 synthase
MHQAAQVLVGRHDFSAFRASECQAKSPIKTIEWANVTREADMIILDIKADAFLHHMVRNIMGTLIHASLEKRDVSWVADIVESRDRAQAGFKAEPQGLILIEISYPSHYNLPME